MAGLRPDLDTFLQIMVAPAYTSDVDQAFQRLVGPCKCSNATGDLLDGEEREAWRIELV